MGGKKRNAERQYDSIAPVYAEAFSGEHEKKPMDREVLRRFAEEVMGKGPVWDLGCGPGQTCAYLKGLGLDISGLDISEQMLHEARAHHPAITFEKGNILSLGFEDGCIGGIVAFYCIIHLAEAEVSRAFAEAYRVLSPGGVFLLAFHMGEGTLRIKEFLGRQVDMVFMFFSTGFVRGRLLMAGFEDVEIIERDPYPEVEYQSRRAYAFARKPSR